MFKRSQKTHFQKEPIICDTIDPPIRPTGSPLRLPLHDVYKIVGIGSNPFGIVEPGALKPGMNATFAPTNIKSEVKSVEMHYTSIPEAVTGDNVGGQTKNDSAREVDYFFSQQIMLNHPGHIENGYTSVFDCHTAQVASKFVEIQSKIEQRTGSAEKSPKLIKTEGSSMILLKPTKLMCVDTFTDSAPLERFAVRKMKKTVAVDIIQDTDKKEITAEK